MAYMFVLVQVQRTRCTVKGTKERIRKATTTTTTTSKFKAKEENRQVNNNNNNTI